MRVAFVLCDNLLATSITLPAEMLRAAADRTRSRRSDPSLQIDFVGLQPQVMTRAGLPLAATHTLSDAETPCYDLIFLPALWRNPQAIVQQHTELLPWLRQQHAKGAWIGAAGTGVCLLAATGLLDDRPATTHWFYFDRFVKQYPAIDLKRQYFITRAGHLYCAASINALADLTVHFIHQFFGAAAASHVERHFSHEARSTFEDVTYREDDRERHSDESIIQIQLWLHQHATESLQLADVAERFGMSVRNFNRRFRAATGTTPLHYLQARRMEQARELLKASNLAVSEIAYRVGYQDPHNFSQLFRRHTSVTPQEYRKSLRSKLFSLR
jgi:transcriptional regulator GlxA family with amidase domain